MLVKFQDSYNTCRWSDFILTPRVRAMGIQEPRIKGAYMNSKHRVREETNSVGNYYMGK